MKAGIFSKLVVAFVILANTVFTAAVLFVFWKTQQEPAALIAAWFAFTTGELWTLSTIRKKKLEKAASCDAEKDVKNADIHTESI